MCLHVHICISEARLYHGPRKAGPASMTSTETKTTKIQNQHQIIPEIDKVNHLRMLSSYLCKPVTVVSYTTLAEHILNIKYIEKEMLIFCSGLK